MEDIYFNCALLNKQVHTFFKITENTCVHWHLCKRQETRLQSEFSFDLHSNWDLTGNNFSSDKIDTKRLFQNMNQKQEHSWIFNSLLFSSVIMLPH